MSLRVSYEGKPFIQGVSRADNFWLRLSGYMFRTKPHHPGILFEPGMAMHTFFMFFALDMVFLDKDYRVVKVVRNMKPWRHTWWYLRARKVLELPVGVLPQKLKEGDVLEVLDV
jgi:uncharacterized protein